MCLEPPETGLLSRPPRNVRKERMANGRLLLQAYGFLGILESLSAMSMSVKTRFFKNQKVSKVYLRACPGRFGTCSVMACRFPRWP